MVQCHIAQSVKFVVQCRQYGSALMGDGIVCRHFFTVSGKVSKKYFADRFYGGAELMKPQPYVLNERRVA